MRIVIISDTHNHPLKNMALPPGDILIHSGDFTGEGKVREVTKFNDYCADILDKYSYGIYVTPGNHDFLAQTQKHLCESILTNCNLMINESIVIDGIKFYFSPYTPWFYDWAFNLPQDDDIAAENMWGLIPTDTDVLITHGPPHGILDISSRNIHIGDRNLLNRINNLNIKLHCFGHNHSGYGSQYMNNILYVNGSICTERYEPVNSPIIVDIDTTSCILVR